ncbi:translocation/assembly module TamB domain-containing protein [Sphingopyxis sp. BSN-002]|uniref:translocation/assembly module TamB domain-containing protein n=1 Tax=Sphingopyxis sp. BSN-002 TaxID=2911495 RepID=UPI001EDA41AF|nr:translocation/assembly module TamB domain-containing protein [Sphingopyxis sp. BSN-002]UKK85236.1 translocation/assembly module TamB domain-containing protein [Sphingopyxis sp. BSN-002]
MAEDGAIVTESEPKAAKPSWPLRIAKWTGIALLGLIALVAIFLIGLNSDAGRRFVANQVEKYQFENGMKIGIGRLDGSLFGEMVIRDFTLSDPKGVFLRSPELRVDWRPFAYLSNHVDVRSATAKTLVMEKIPAFKPVPDTGEPLLPDIDIDVAKLQVDRFVFEPAVAGQRRVATLSGKIAIADRRAQVTADARTIAGGGGEGDTLKLLLDAVPEQNRLAMTLDMTAPKGGVLAALGGFEEPLTAKLDGRGDWKVWNGNLTANLGANPLARLSLSARDGTFAVKGSTQASRLLAEGPVAGVLGTETSVDLTARLNERKADIDGRFTSDAAQLGVSGGIDLGNSRYDGLKLALNVLRPGAIAPALRANGLRATAQLDGAFDLPTVDYTANANSLAVNDIIVETLNLAGKARVDADQIVIPVAGRAVRIRGLDTVAGGTLTQVRLDGDLAYANGRILSDNLRLRSPRIDAKVIMIADLNKGFYTGAVDGRINDYRIESVGLFDIDTDADLKTAPRGGFEIVGRVRARSTKLFNSGVRDFLGGNATASSDVRYGTDGIIRFANLRMTAPKLRVTGGQGSYAPNGQIQLAARANSTDYGPVGVQLAGTISDPRAVVTADRPGLGIGLANLVAKINGAPNGYRLAATGETDYGPLSADVVLLTAVGPLTIDIERGDLSGIGFHGRLVKSNAGPFVGQLDASGQGLGGIVRLSAAGQYQAAAINVRANNVVLPGAAKLAVGSAIVDADVTLYDQPHIVADIQLADTQIRTYDIAVGRVKIDYRNGSGQAQALVEGTSGVPFRIAANADLKPDLWRASVQGRATGVNFRTTTPARIIPGRNGYELLPTTVDLGRGSSARVAGRFGEGIMIQSRLDRANMALVNSIYPGLGLGGRATGSIDFEQASEDAFPRADARLTIDGFTRTTAASVSQPVDINFAGKLLSDGGEARAVIRKRGTVIGRMQASLRPLGPGAGDWTTRLRAAPLGGGVRYNGPADTLYSFFGPADQGVSGPIAVAADFSCRVSDPCLEGVVRGNGMAYENQAYGTRLTNMVVNGRFTGNRLEIDDLTATAGDGMVKAKGFVSLSEADGYPMNISATLDNARLAKSENIAARATGTLTLEKVAGQTALLSGDLRLPETRYRIVREGAASVPVLTGVRRKPPTGRRRISGDGLEAVGGSLFDLIRLNIHLRAGDEIYVSGMGLESEWQADVTLTGTTQAPRVAGEIELVRGTLGFAGRSFDLEEGRVTFPTGDAFDPSLRLLASDTIETVTVNINVSGRAMNPQITFSSVPGLPQDEIVSRILFGDSVTSLSPLQAVQLAASLNSLRGGGGGLSPLGALRSATGIDRLRILGPDDTVGRGTALAAGQYISKDIYLEVITDARGYTATQLEISLTPALSILSQTGAAGGQSNLSVRYRKDY